MIYRRQALTKLSVNGYKGVAEIDLTSIDLTSIDLTNIDLTNIDLTNIDLTSIELTNIDLTNIELTNIDLTNIDHWRRARLFATSLNDRVVNKLPKGAMAQRSPIDSHAQSITSGLDLRAPIDRRSVTPWL